MSVVGLPVQIDDVFDAGDELATLLGGNDPPLAPVGLQRVFFERLSDSFLGGRFNDAQLDSLLSQQTQRPAGLPFGWLAACPGREACLGSTVELPDYRRANLLLSIQRGFETLRDEAFPDGSDRIVVDL